MQVVEYKNKGKFDNDYMYANQWIGLTEKTTLKDKIHLGAEFDKKCSGGQNSDINIQSRFPNFESAWKLTNEIANEGVIYFAFNMKINVCEDDHAFIGSHCKCGKTAVNQFSRVVGFLTPKSSYSAPRKKEFDARKWYNVID